MRFILLVIILLFATSGIDGNTIDTPTLNPNLHYINITIVYHIKYIPELYVPMEDILPGYGVVLASCYLNITNQVVDSTTHNTSDTISVGVQNLNISLFLDSYRVTATIDENDEGDTTVRFEFYLSQDGTLIPATTAIEVFNKNCNTNDWRDDFTSNSIPAEAVFSSMQLTQSISSQTVSNTFSQNTLISTFPSSTQSLEPTPEVSTTVTPSQHVTTSISTSLSPETSSTEFSSTAIPVTTSVPSSMLQLSTSIPSSSPSMTHSTLQTESVFTSTNGMSSSEIPLASNTASSFTSSISVRIIPSTTVTTMDTTATQFTSSLTEGITNFENTTDNYFSSSLVPQSSNVRTMDTGSLASTSIPQSSRIPTYFVSSLRNLSTSITTGNSSSSLPIASVQTILSQYMSTRATDLIVSNSTQFLSQASRSLDRNITQTVSTQLPVTNSTVELFQQITTSISASQPADTTRLLLSSSYTSLPIFSTQTIPLQSNTFGTTDSSDILSTVVTQLLPSPVNSTQFLTSVSVTSTRSLDRNLTQTNSTQPLLNSTIIPRNMSIPTSSSTVLPVISSTQDISQVIPSRSVLQEPSSLFSSYNITSIQSTTTRVFLPTTTPPIIDTPTLNPNLHYINVTIVYHTKYIPELYVPSEDILPGYGVVLASCYLNITNQIVDSTTHNTSDTISVGVQNLNISLFLDSYRVTATIDENDEGDTTVRFEFYLSQDGTLIPATTAIEVFNKNCNTNDWRDDFTSNSIPAEAVFNSMQSQAILTSSYIGLLTINSTQAIPTSSYIGLPTINSTQTIPTSHSIPQQPSSSLFSSYNITSIQSTTTRVFLPTTTPPIIDTPTLNPNLHYINITIVYHTKFISELYVPMEDILPGYGVVLASCYLNITNQVVDSTTHNTSDIISVGVQNLNISLFLDSYRVTATEDVNDEGDTTVRFEFYLSQDGTLIPATTAIEVFNRNCNTNDWRDDFTSNDIAAEAVFNSMQSQAIPTSSSIGLPTINSTQTIPTSHFIPQQPSSALFNTSSIPIIPSTSQSILSTFQPITTPTYPTVTSTVQSATPISPPIQPTLHYLEAIFTFQSLGDTDTNQIPYILQAIASRYLDTTVTILPSESTLLLSITIGDVTFNALRNESNQPPPVDNIVTARILFYVTNNTTPLLSTGLKRILDVYSVDQWSGSTGLQILSAEFNLYRLVTSSSSVVPTLSTSSSDIPILSTRSSVVPTLSTSSSVIPTLSTSSSVIPTLSTRSSVVPIFNTSSVIPTLSSRSSVVPIFNTSSVVPIFNTSSVIPILSTISSVIPILSTISSVIPTLSTSSSVIPTLSTISSVIPILSTISSVIPTLSTRSSVVPIFNSSSFVRNSSIPVISHSTMLHSIFSSMRTVSTITPPPEYVSLPDYNPGIGYLLVLNLLTNQSQGAVNLSQSLILKTELQLINLFSLALEKESSVNSRRRRNTFNTTTRLACDIVQDLTTADPTNLRLIFYISREVNNIPLIILTANTSLAVYRQLEDSDYKALLGYEFVSISIYQGPVSLFSTVTLLVGCILGCCILILVVFLITLSLYHCLHSNYIRVDKWSPDKSLDVSFSNQGAYTSSTSKLLSGEGVSVTDRFSEGTQTLAQDFLNGTNQFDGDKADYSFTLRTEPELFSPVHSEEIRPLKGDLDQSDAPPQYSQSLAGLKSVIEEERRLAVLAEASLLEVMSSNRMHMDSMLEESARRERASAVYDKSKKEMSVSTGAATPFNSLRSSEESSRSQSRPKSGYGSKVAPSDEAPNLSFSSKSTPATKILDWVPVSPEKLSKPTPLTGFRSVKQPNIMQVVPRQGLRPLSPLPSYTPTPDPPIDPLKPIPVRIIGADGMPVQMRSSNTDGVATTRTINVLPSFNPFYTTAKKD